MRCEAVGQHWKARIRREVMWQGQRTHTNAHTQPVLGTLGINVVGGPGVCAEQPVGQDG